jgi:hypothetical protein
MRRIGLAIMLTAHFLTAIAPTKRDMASRRDTAI